MAAHRAQPVRAVTGLGGPGGGPFPTLGQVGPHERAVGELVARARAEVPFYAAHHAGVTSLALHDQPTCTKADLAGHGPFPLSARPLSAMRHVSATSGTTGPRLFVGYTAADWAALGDQYGHVVAAAGIGPDDVLLNTHGGGLWIGAPSLQELAHAAGAGTIPAGPTNPAQVIEWLVTLPITLLSATPSYLRVLRETAAASGVDLSITGLRMALVGGEGATPEVRRQVVDAFGPSFRWQELYGSTETAGPILAFGDVTDPLSGCLEVNTSYFVIELLRIDADEPVEPGQVGEITLTTPYREGSPLVRYRTRDLAAAVPDRFGAASGLPVMTSLVGRVDDAIKVRGALVYPAIIEEVCVALLAPGAEWRIRLTREQAQHDVLTVVVETDDPATVAAIAERIGHVAQVRPVVDAVPPGSLERFEGKAKRVLDQR